MGIMDIFGGGAGTSASSDPFANAASGVQPVGGRRYNSFLDPQGPVPIGSLIGSLMGAPTRDQAKSQASGAAMQSIMRSMSGGQKTFQQATQEYFSSEEGQDFFINGDMDSFLQSAQMFAASPQGPGAQMMDPMGSAGSGVPTAAMQDYNQLTGEANPEGDPVKQQAYAELAIAGKFATSPNTTAQERAAGYLVQTGEIDQTMAAKMVLGEIKVLEVRNNEETIGWQIVDIAGGGKVLKYIGANTGDLGKEPYPDAALGALANPVAPQVGQVVPTADGGAGAAPQVLPPGGPQGKPNDDPTGGAFGTLVGQEPDASQLQGAGLANYAIANVGGVLGQWFPALSGAEEDSRMNMLQQIEADATGLYVEGRNLKAVQMKFDALFHAGVMTNEIQTATNLLDIRKYFSRAAQVRMATFKDRKLDDKVRAKAQEEYVALRTALTNIPTIPELEATIEYFNTQPGAIPTALGVGREALDTVEEGVGEMFNPPPSFANDAEASKAVEADPEAYPSGTKIIIGGKERWVP